MRIANSETFGPTARLIQRPSWFQRTNAGSAQKRTLATTTEFVNDVPSRMRNRVQISTDALRGYAEAIEQHFGADVDYGQIVKVYTHDAAQHPERKYRPHTLPLRSVGRSQAIPSGNQSAPAI